MPKSFISTPTGTIDKKRVQGTVPSRKFRDSWLLNNTTNVIGIDVELARTAFLAAVSDRIEKVVKPKARNEYLNASILGDASEQVRLRKGYQDITSFDLTEQTTECASEVELVALWDSHATTLGTNPFK